MVRWFNGAVVKWQEGEMVILLNGDMMIWCYSILLGKTCNTSCFLYLSKQLKNIMGSDFPESNSLKTQLESLTEELIQLCQDNKEQWETLNRVHNFLEQLCSVNG